nr:uncharacterized protein LOC112938679 [Oryza sativa Japonica Group]
MVAMWGGLHEFGDVASLPRRRMVVYREHGRAADHAGFLDARASSSSPSPPATVLNPTGRPTHSLSPLSRFAEEPRYPASDSPGTGVPTPAPVREVLDAVAIRQSPGTRPHQLGTPSRSGRRCFAFARRPASTVRDKLSHFATSFINLCRSRIPKESTRGGPRWEILFFFFQLWPPTPFLSFSFSVEAREYTVDDDRSSCAVAEPVHRRQDFAEPRLILDNCIIGEEVD